MSFPIGFGKRIAAAAASIVVINKSQCERKQILASDKNQLELQRVVSIVRHGSRTPLKDMSPILGDIIWQPDYIFKPVPLAAQIKYKVSLLETDRILKRFTLRQ